MAYQNRVENLPNNRVNPDTTICPNLEKKMGRNGSIYQPSFGWWENGEYQNPQILTGESAMWRRDVKDVKVYTDPIPKPPKSSKWMSMSKEERHEWITTSENRPHIVLRVVSEYGSARDEGGWTRQMVMYEENTPSPYPFTHDMFTEKNDKMTEDLKACYTFFDM